MHEIMVTQEQYDSLVEKVKKVEQDLDDARKRIGEAASYGDLSENSEYEAAKEDEQLFCAMLVEMRTKLASCTVMQGEIKSIDGEAVIGSTVKVLDKKKKKEFTYILVGGGDDFDFDRGEIPYTSPIGQALQGAKKGESVDVQIGAKTRHLKILDIS